MKRFGQEESLKGIVKRYGSRAQERELEQMEKESALGREYLKGLRREVKRLMLTAEEQLDGETVEKLTDKLEREELLELEKVFGKRVGRALGLGVQIRSVDAAEKEAEEDFRV